MGRFVRYFISGIILTAIIVGMILYDERNPVLIKAIDRVVDSVVYVELLDEYDSPIGSGSGVIVDPNGLILTAGHMVDRVDRFRIILSDGREFYSVESFSKYETVGVGLIKIEARDLSYSEFGDSQNLRRGQEVFIIGNPFGIMLHNTVSKGIISGLGREIDMFGTAAMFQSDSQASLGNSGGPVCNMKGKIIGIVVGGVRGLDGMTLIIPGHVCEDVIDIYKIETRLKNAS